MLSVPTFLLAPLLIARETNLKFRQAPAVTHHELTSIWSMASFQGERQQTSAPRGPLSTLCAAAVRVPVSLGLGDGNGMGWVSGSAQHRDGSRFSLTVLYPVHSQTFGPEIAFNRLAYPRSVSRM